MSYDVKGHILGFEDTNSVEIVEIDELFATMKDADNEAISFTLVNPYPLREYSFDVPAATQALLELNEDSNVKDRLKNHVLIFSHLSLSMKITKRSHRLFLIPKVIPILVLLHP